MYSIPCFVTPYAGVGGNELLWLVLLYQEVYKFIYSTVTVCEGRLQRAGNWIVKNDI
jgi:hypothetical protein